MVQCTFAGSLIILSTGIRIIGGINCPPLPTSPGQPAHQDAQIGDADRQEKSILGIVVDILGAQPWTRWCLMAVMFTAGVDGGRLLPPFIPGRPFLGRYGFSTEMAIISVI